MAAPPKKSATPTRKASARPREPRAAAPSASVSNPNRLLREAAWSRMFGRTDSKNPFTR